MEKHLYYLNLFLLHLLIAFIVNLPKQDKATKNWAKLFGWAQGIMAIQVLVGWQAGSAIGDMAYTLSALNNIFYLGAALILLENLGGGWRYLLSNRKFRFITLASVLAVGLLASKWLLVGSDPNLAWWFRQVAVAVIVLISIVVYLVEGTAYYYVLGLFRHRWIRYLPLLIALTSSVIELLVLYTKDIEVFGYFISGIRYLYFACALVIVLTRMPQDVWEVFGKATQEREFILAKQTGFVEAIGTSTAAHKVLLLITKPDFILDDSYEIRDNFIYFGWHDEKGEEKDKDGGGDDLLADITEKERQCLYKVCQSNEYAVCDAEGGKETIVLPITMYGGLIGVLFVRLHRGVRARAVFVEKLKHAVQAIFPLVQSSRQMTAIRMLSDRFTTNLNGESGVDKADSNGTYPSVTEGVNEMLVSLLKLLSPLAIALRPSQHFNSQPPVLWQIEEPEFPEESEFPVASKDAFEQKYFAPKPDKTLLKEVRPFQQDLELGRLIMFVPEKKDELGRPTIGLHKNVFKALGALINSTLKTIIRRNLNRILRVADMRIGEGSADGQHIAQVLQEAAQAFGVSWVVVALDGARFFGNDEKVALVRQRADVSASDREFTHVKVKTADGRETWVIHSTAAWDVNSLPGGNGSARRRLSFWFGVDRPDFKWDETWPGIFQQFIQFGTNKIKDMLMMEMEVKIAENEKSKALMSLVYHQGNLTHQFGTLIKEVECAVKSLELDIEEFKLELPERVEQDVVWLKESYDQLLKLTRSMFRDTLRTKPYMLGQDEENDQRCDLRKAIDKALADVELKANRFNIELPRNGTQGEGELPVEAPFHVAYLGVYNLLSNSIKALSDVNARPRQKRIDITTKLDGDNVYCRVSDTGPGLENVDQLYELDSGLGLCITKMSLQDNNCNIKLIGTGPSGTTFELTFPVSRQKRSEVEHATRRQGV